jgi:hypothetical protein
MIVFCLFSISPSCWECRQIRLWMFAENATNHPTRMAIAHLIFVCLAVANPLQALYAARQECGIHRQALQQGSFQPNRVTDFPVRAGGKRQRLWYSQFLQSAA